MQILKIEESSLAPVEHVDEVQLEPELEKNTSAKDVQWEVLCSEQDKLIANNPDIRCSQINKSVHRAVQNRQVRSLGTQEDTFKLTRQSYHRTYQLLLHAEEAHEHIDMRKFDQFKARVRLSPNCNARDPLYEYDLVGLSKGHPNLMPGDTVILDDGVLPRRFEIKNIELDTIMFGPKKRGASLGGRDEHFSNDITRQAFKISFVTSGFTYDRYAENLQKMGGLKQFERMIFEDQDDFKLTGSKRSPKINLEATGGHFVDERLAQCNTLQRQAIKNILESWCRPNLYILFGPPGTGKTFTLVEIVIQIVKRNSKARILISANSNNCVDHLAEMIRNTGHIPKLIRLSSKSHYLTKEKAGAVPEYYTTNPNKPSQYRVVLSTNMMSCRLQSTFDFVLVDEAGHAHVPDSMLPMSKVARDGCFVLAGDPKQLGPVIKCREVQKLGLGISLLERLFKFKRYARTNGQYDARYITRLTDSYRCDPRILGLCNRLFYHGDLKCLGKTPPSILKILGFKKPLVFSQVSGREHTPRYSTSRGNNLEADFCIEYIFRLYRMGFEPHQIGVITPYLLQRELLIEKFDKKLQRHKSLLDDRFKLAKMSTAKENEKRQRKDNLASSTKSLLAQHSSCPIDDMAFLTKALNQLKLYTENTCERRELAAGIKRTDWHCKIDTVDAFQGNEREVIIISTVRTPDKDGAIRGGGFLADAKRFNVALSRAKWLVIVVGHGAVLNCCKLWKRYDGASCRSKLRF